MLMLSRGSRRRALGVLLTAGVGVLVAGGSWTATAQSQLGPIDLAPTSTTQPPAQDTTTTTGPSQTTTTQPQLLPSPTTTAPPSSPPAPGGQPPPAPAPDGG